MNLKNRFRLVIFSMVALLVSLSVIMAIGIRYTNAHIEQAIGIDDLVVNLYEIRILNGEYIANPSERVKQQWQAKYAQIRGKLIKQHSLPESVKEALDGLQQTFERLTSLPDPETGRKAFQQHLRNQVVAALTLESQRIIDWASDISSQTKGDIVPDLIIIGVVMFAVILFAILVNITVILITTRHILLSVNRLKEGAAEIADGTMGFQVEQVGSDEISMLTASINQMSRGLKDSYENLKERTAQLEAEIEERKLAEVALRESEESFRAVFEQSTVGNSLTAPDGKLLRINKAFANMLGYTIEEISQINFAEITHPDDIAKSRESIRILLSDEQSAYAFEKRYIHKSGDIVWVELSTTLLRDDQGTPLHFITSVVNRTKHKQAEEALREADELLQTAVTQSPSGILIASAPDVTIRMANPAALGIRGGDQGILTGIDVTKHTANWLTFRADGSPYPPEQLPLSRAVLKGEVTQNEEVIIRDEAGNDHWVSANAAPVRNLQGNITAGIVIFQDVTERRQAEEALRESEERYRMIFNNSPMGVMHFDANGIIIDFNDNFAQIMGGTREKILGFNMLEKLQDQAMTKAVKDALDGRLGYYEGDYVSVTAGKTTPIRAIYQRMTTADGKFLGAVGLFEDIGERKRAEAALQESESQFRSYVENAPIGVFVCDETGRYLQVNPAATKITGYTSEELLTLSIPDLLPQESQSLAAQYFQVVAETGRVSAELSFRHKHGRIGILSLEGVRLSPTRFMGLVTDITERKEAEEEKGKLQEQLLKAQKLEAIGQLAGGVAHDFNNMLGVILGHAEIAIDRVDPSDPQHADLQEIRNAAERSAALTRQMLTFARKQVVSPKVLDLNESVKNMLKMLERLIGEDIHLVWLPGEQLWQIKIDPSQIDQILANLCVNARDAIAGVGKIIIETKPCNCDDDFCALHAGCISGEYALLMVSDSGCGMHKETLEKIFDPFFTTKEIGKGTGLGLATVYGIIKQNNGMINVYSEPGHGTTFQIYLPRHKGEAETVQKTVPQQQLLRGQETILLVEDEPSLMDLNKLILQKQGYRVLAAGTPDEAIRLAADYKEEIHLLMTDVVMPQMNGMDLAKHLLAINPQLKCLFTSGYTSDVIAPHGVLDEGINFIQKPFSRRDLAAKIREVLD